MPPEVTKAKSKRKMRHREIEEDRFDGDHAREIEQKRNGRQISCAECTRLKIKCDKQIPCQSCQRRGCSALCPNGSLSTGERFILPATENLHRRIAKMSERIRELEDALGDLQAQHSTEPHPLLREDLLGVNHHTDDDKKEETPPDVSGHPSELLDAFGTLSITDHGISRFFGPTGGSEQGGLDSSPPKSARGLGTSKLHQDLRLFSEAFPFTPMGPTGIVRELIEAHLPNWERASYLSQAYSDRAGWLIRCVSKDQVIDELLPLFYSNAPLKETDDNKSVHELALLFLVFAIGALVDVVQETSNEEAEHYHQIARAAISLQPVLEKPSLVTIQGLFMLSMYNAMSGNELSGKETSMESTWSLIVLAAHLAETIGLHRDSARWGLPDKIVQRRRVLFWDLFAANAWGSLSTGRPPCFSLAYIDCRYPGCGNVSNRMDVKTGALFESWNYRFVTECVAEVAARTLTAEIPSYATIMDLDRKVREFPIPKEAENVVVSLNSHIPTNPMESPPAPDLMGCFAMAYAREVILLYIHRCFFAQAIIENPENPLKSQYAPSFRTAYQVSLIILRTTRTHYSNYPQLCARFWNFWTFAFSAAIVFGTIVTRGPKSPLASNAIKELDEACILFTKGACYSRRAAKALPILTKLREKAHNALAAAQNDKSSSSSSSSSRSQLGQEWSFREGVDVDELAIFGGRTRFVSTRRLPAELKQTQAQAPPEGGRSSGLVSSSYGAGLPESTTALLPPASESLYRAEGAISSSVERWAATTDREQMQQQYSFQHAPAHPPLLPPSAAEYIDVRLELEPKSQQKVMPQWQPHHMYTSQRQHEHHGTTGSPRLSSGSLPQPLPQLTSHRQPQHTHTDSGHEHAVSMTSYQCSPSSSGMPNHFEGTGGYWTSDVGELEPPQPQSQLPSLAPVPISHHEPQYTHSGYEYAALVTPYQYAPSSSGMSNHFEGARGYGTSNGGSGHLGHHNVHVHAQYSHAHEHAHESLHTNTYQPPPHPPPTSSAASSQAPPSEPAVSVSALPPQYHAPSELMDLGLVAQVSRLDERWTSFMRDSGYFEGFGYQSR